MSQSSTDLAHEMAVMTDVFPELAERLDHAAEQLRARGAPLPGSLIEELLSWRRDFDDFRDRLRALAGSLEVATGPDESLAGLQELSTLLEEVGEAEVRQKRSEKTRRRALAVLDKVLSLSHATDADSQALRTCQEQAQALHRAISTSRWNALPAEAEPMAKGEHALAHLVTLIEDRDELSDDLWASYSASVGTAFGRSLAAAAGRSRLILPTERAAALA
jgi:hypothetical protein